MRRGYYALTVALALLAWPLSTAAQSTLIPAGDSMGSAATASPSGRRLMSSDGVGPSKIWNADTGRVEVEFGEDGAFYAHAAFHPSRDELAAASGDRISFWNSANGALLHRFKLDDEEVLFLRYVANGRRLMLWSSKRRVFLIDDAELPNPAVEALTNAPLADAVASWDGGRLALLAHDDDLARIDVWDAAPTRLLSSIKMEGGDRIALAGFSVDGARLATLKKPSELQLWDAATGAEIAALSAGLGLTFSGWRTAFSENGDHFAALADDGSLLLWSASDGVLRGRLREAPGATIWRLYADDQGKIFALTSGDAPEGRRELRLWDFSGAQIIARFEAGPGTLPILGGRKIAMMVDGGVQLIDPSALEPSGAPLPRKLKSWRGAIYFSADGSRLFYSTQEATEIWRLE